MYGYYVKFDILGSESPEVGSPTDANTTEIDYQEIEDCFYRALSRVEQDKMNREALTRSLESDSDMLVFHTPTDAQLYTVVAEPTSSAQQTTAYLLDIRNFLIIFLFAWFLFTSYSKLKNTLKSYTGGKE